MDKYDKDILTIRKITDDTDYILVEENSRTYHPDRCTPVVTETSGLLPHLLEPKFKVGDTVRLIDDSYVNEGKPKGYTFTVAEVAQSSDKRYQYREQA